MSTVEIKKECEGEDPDWFVASCSSTGLILVNESTRWYPPGNKLRDPAELLAAIIEYLHRHGEAVGDKNHVDYVRLRKR